MIEEFILFCDDNFKLTKKRIRPLRARFTAEEIKNYARIFYNNQDTVLKIGDETFVAQTEKGEKFDPEKGLLVCLVKALGLTTSDVLDLYGRAEVKKSKRKANVIKQDKMNKKRK